MDFTREPVIETIITPKEGCKLVVRSSKGTGQEEYFVDSVEIVSFGNAFFFRSLEKPKNFLLPVIDYEILEVREARMVLKHVGVEKTIKIGTGRQAPSKKAAPTSESKEEEKKEPKKREKRKSSRRRRSRTETEQSEELLTKTEAPIPPPKPDIPRPILTPPPLISETINRYKEDFKQAFYPMEGDEAPQEETPPPPKEDLWNFSEEEVPNKEES